MPLLKKLEGRIKNGLLRALVTVPYSKAPTGVIDIKKVTRLLVVRPQKIGDVFISLPLIDFLKRHNDGLKVSMVVSPDSRVLVTDDPRFEAVHVYRKRLLNDFAELRKMRTNKYDTVIDLVGTDSATSALLTGLAAPGAVRIGVGKKAHRKYYHYNFDHRCGDTGHIISNTLKAVEAFGLTAGADDGFAVPYIPPDVLDMADRFMNKLRGGGEITLVGYNLSAGSSGRRWPDERAAALIEKILATDERVRVVLISIPGERGRVQKLKERLGDRVELIPDRLGLIEAAAIIGRLDMLVTPDTSLVHIARSFGVPVVGLYVRYMNNYMTWKPYGQKSGQVVASDDNSVAGIDVEDVLTAFNAVLAEKKQETLCPPCQSSS